MCNKLQTVAIDLDVAGNALLNAFNAFVDAKVGIHLVLDDKESSIFLC